MGAILEQLTVELSNGEASEHLTHCLAYSKCLQHGGYVVVVIVVSMRHYWRQGAEALGEGLMTFLPSEVSHSSCLCLQFHHWTLHIPLTKACCCPRGKEEER
jgi:hypothetical protein